MSCRRHDADSFNLVSTKVPIIQCQNGLDLPRAQDGHQARIVNLLADDTILCEFYVSGRGTSQRPAAGANRFQVGVHDGSGGVAVGDGHGSCRVAWRAPRRLDAGVFYKWQYVDYQDRRIHGSGFVFSDLTPRDGRSDYRPTDGQLYASTSTNDIYRFARGSTNLELVGNAGVVAGAFRLAFDSTGRLFGAVESNFYSINKSTAVASAVGTMNSVGSTSRFDFAFRPEDGMLYAVGNYSPGYSLFTIDPATGGTTPIGLSIVRPGGLAFLTVPEPSAFMLFCVGPVCLARRWRFNLPYLP